MLRAMPPARTPTGTGTGTGGSGTRRQPAPPRRALREEAGEGPVTLY